MKPVLIIFGNCQAQGLHGAVAGLPTFVQEYDVKYVPNQASLGDTTLPAETLARCQILWEQVGINQRLPGWENVPANAKHVRFAELSFPILWPFNCVDPRNRYDPPEFPWGAWPYGDRLALQIAGEGLRGEQAVSAYIERGAALIPNTSRMLDIEIARSRKRDANVDLSMTAYILDNFRDRRLFATYNHAANSLVWELFLRIMGETVLSSINIPTEEFASCRSAFMDPGLKWPNFETIQMPVHPKLAEEYQLSWVNADTHYRHFDSGSYTFSEFITRYIEYIPPASEKVLSEVRDPLPQVVTPKHDLLDKVAKLTQGMVELSEVLSEYDECSSRDRGENLTYARLTGNPLPPIDLPKTVPLSSRICRQSDLVSDSFRYWMAKMNHKPLMHRGYWEWFYIAQVLFERGVIKENSNGLTFSNGPGPLVALMASLGCNVTAVDLPRAISSAHDARPASQQSTILDELNDIDICQSVEFKERVKLLDVNMEQLSKNDLMEKFDFLWAGTCLSHVGSIDRGAQFILWTLEFIKPGGVAVYTCDYNMSHSDETFESNTFSLFRRSDIEALERRLATLGHRLLHVDWHDGCGSADSYIDKAPYGSDPHLRLQILQFTVTSLGLIVMKQN